MDEKTAGGDSRSNAAGCFFCDTAMPMLEGLVSDSTRELRKWSRVASLTMCSSIGIAVSQKKQPSA